MSDGYDEEDSRALIAMIQMGDWSIDKVSCYDEEGVEGWEWSYVTAGRSWIELGSWDDLPSVPDGAIQWLRKTGWLRKTPPA